MGAHAPQWLLGSFVEAMQQIGATAPTDELAAEARDLAERWSAEGRALHDLHRLIKVLTHIDEISLSAHDPDLLRIAAWYHGAFLNRALEVRLGGFEAQFASARCIDHAHNRLTELGVSEEVVARIDELIAFLTRHRAPRTDFDAQVLVDADLAVLACSPQDYKKFREKLRLELHDLDDVQFLKARCALVKRLLGYDRIYQSPLGNTWENAARANLEVELARLEDAKAKLCPGPDDEADADDADDEPYGANRVTTTGTLIIKRRTLKKNPCPPPPEEATGTGILPVKAPEPAPDADEPEATSSLESAVESLDLPATPVD